LKRYLGDRAEDVMQETFFSVSRELKRDPNIGLKNESLQALIYVIAARTATDDLRSESRRRRLHNDLALFPIDSPSPADADAMAKEISRELRRALLKLPYEDRRVLLLYFVGGYSARDVARRTRTTVKAAQNRIGRARERVMAHMEAVLERSRR
jgi:RNA polymerase sigma-70 factor, ECF subfamily